jgi:hypothetical protein
VDANAIGTAAEDAEARYQVVLVRVTVLADLVMLAELELLRR